MKILVCGGRNLRNYLLVSKALHRFPVGTEMCHGGAFGADSLAASYGRQHFWKVTEFRADWQTHGKAAGPIRNQRMLDEFKPELVIAFPGGNGTADMVRRARKAGVPVEVVDSEATR
jgi:hypothetical protein